MAYATEKGMKSWRMYCKHGGRIVGGVSTDTTNMEDHFHLHTKHIALKMRERMSVVWRRLSVSRQVTKVNNCQMVKNVSLTK